MLRKTLLNLSIFIMKAIGWLPYRLTYYVFSFVSLFVYAAAVRHRRIALSNIETAFKDSMSETEMRNTAKECFKNMALMFLDMCRMPRITRADIGKNIRIINAEYVYEAARKGKGILFCTGHFGSWELLPHIYSLYFNPMQIVVRPLDSKLADDAISYFRTYCGNSLIAKKKALMPIIRSLSKNGQIGTLHDQNVRKREGIFVDFFGEKACTTFAPALIALRTGAPIISGYIVRKGINDYNIIFEKEIIVPKGMGNDDAVHFITQSITKSLENMIRKYPGHWFWVHRRWKTQPPGNNKKYD